MSRYFNLNSDSDINPYRDKETVLSEIMAERTIQKDEYDDFDDMAEYDGFEEAEKRIKNLKKQLKKHSKKIDAQLRTLDERTRNLEQKTQATETKLNLVCDAMGRFIIGSRNRTTVGNNQISDTIVLREGEYNEVH